MNPPRHAPLPVAPPPPEATFTVRDIVHHANVSLRTIRHYIGEKVVPAPAFRSSKTRYDRAFLVRLRAALAMRRTGAHLPTIRQHLDSASPDELMRLAGYTPDPAPAPVASPAGAPTPGTDSAAPAAAPTPGTDFAAPAAAPGTAPAAAAAPAPGTAPAGASALGDAPTAAAARGGALTPAPDASPASAPVPASSASPAPGAGSATSSGAPIAPAPPPAATGPAAPERPLPAGFFGPYRGGPTPPHERWEHFEVCPGVKLLVRTEADAEAWRVAREMLALFTSPDPSP